MNKKFLILILILLVLVVNPQIALTGATNGLLLWFHVIVPTILPFMIISQLIQNVYGGSINNPVLYCAIIGLLCGFPMGAFSVSSMYSKGRINKKMAYLLFACCNISSPAFVISYIAMTNLKYQTFPYTYLILNYLPVLFILLYVMILSKDNLTVSSHPDNMTKSLNFDELDNAITGSILNILKLGVYIIIFSILGTFMKKLPIDNEIFKSLILGFSEITTGINYACSGVLSYDTSLIVTLIINAFGGFSCMFQSNIFIKKSGLSIKKYMYSKIIMAFLTLVIWYLLVHVLNIPIK